MSSETKNLYYLFKEGAVQEEPWEWSDLEAMCRDGRLSPDSLVFMPDEKEWRKAGETDLAPLIIGTTGSGGDTGDDEAEAAGMREAYERALEQMEQSPGLLVGLLNGAEIAAAMGRRHHSTVHTAAQRLAGQLQKDDVVDIGERGAPIAVTELVDQLRDRIVRGAAHS